MKILVTGAAGFIGFHVVKKLVSDTVEIVGIDNINAYYDTDLKYARLQKCGIEKNNIEYAKAVQSSDYRNYKFAKIDVTDLSVLEQLFEEENFDLVIHLAAQVGVRYSIDNPHEYVQSNLVGFINVLECVRHYKIKRIIYASSSSVYGMAEEAPFKEEMPLDKPVSLYAATKKSNELMAYSYSHLYKTETIGLRFFTVYGPWGRPDMAMSLFTEAVLSGKPVKVFNDGNLSRDFTYIDDIVGGIRSIVQKQKLSNLWSVYNIGNSKPVKLLEFIEEIEEHTGIKAVKEYLPMQLGDVEETWADVSELREEFGYSPSVSVKEGVRRFIDWYRAYHVV